MEVRQNSRALFCVVAVRQHSAPGYDDFYTLGMGMMTATDVSVFPGSGKAESLIRGGLHFAGVVGRIRNNSTSLSRAVGLHSVSATGHPCLNEQIRVN